MPSVIHKIDPFADTIIILKNPCKSFAPWEDKLTNYKDLESSIEHTRDNRSVQHGRKNRENREAEPAGLPLEPTESEDEEIHYLVSSSHLILASPWFRRVLTTKAFTESWKDSTDGRYHIQASDWDAEALLILLSIFHLRTRQIPRAVSLEMLAKLAVLVDYYELENAEVMERDVKEWITNLRRSVAIPSFYCRDLMLWICVSQVFRMQEEFTRATAVAIKTSKGLIQTLDLPIQQKVISRIDRSRCNAIEQIISELHRLLGVYRDFNYGCPSNRSLSFQCGAMFCGALMRYMEKWGYLSPRPKNPFVGISLDTICNNRSGMEARTKWWEKMDEEWWKDRDQSQRYKNSCFGAHTCSLKFEIDVVVDNAMAEVNGLELQNSA